MLQNVYKYVFFTFFPNEKYLIYILMHLECLLFYVFIANLYMCVLNVIYIII